VEATHKGHDDVVVLGSRKRVAHARIHIFFTGRHFRSTSLVLGVVDDRILPCAFNSTRATHGGSHHIKTFRGNIHESLLKDVLLISSGVETLSSAVGYYFDHPLGPTELKDIGVVMSHGSGSDVLEQIKVKVAINVRNETPLGLFDVRKETKSLGKVTSNVSNIFNCLLVLRSGEIADYFRS
jgi:hypothetical protein